MPNFHVRVRCQVLKNVYCEGCTEEQARYNTWEYAVDVYEADQEDWEVISVEKADA